MGQERQGKISASPPPPLLPHRPGSHFTEALSRWALNQPPQHSLLTPSRLPLSNFRQLIFYSALPFLIHPFILWQSRICFRHYLLLQAQVGEWIGASLPRITIVAVLRQGSYTPLCTVHPLVYYSYISGYFPIANPHLIAESLVPSTPPPSNPPSYACGRGK